MAAFARTIQERDPLNRRSSTPNIKSEAKNAVDPASQIQAGTLTPRQNSVLHMQQTRGNAVVCRMLTRQEGQDALQRFSDAEHQGLADDSGGTAANAANGPMLTDELYNDIKTAKQNTQASGPYLASMKANVDEMYKLTPKEAPQPLPPAVAGFAQSALGVHNIMQEEQLSPAADALKRVTGAFSA